jgi:HEAT repeat protein
MVLGKAIVEAPPEGASLILEALAQEYRPAEVRFLGEALGGRLDPKVREQIVATLGRLYFDRPPYPGTWWGTQPAAQKPPARTVAWEGTPFVRDALLKALADRDAAVRRAAVAALTAANDPATLEPLAARLAAEKEPAARLDLIRAISGLKTPKIVPVLQGVLADRANAEALRLEAVRGLEQVKASAAATALASVTTEDQPAALRVRALEAIGSLQAKSAQPAIQAALASREPTVRRAAVAALGQLGDAAAAADLLPLLNDTDASVKVAAVQALGALKAKEAIPALVQAVGNEATQFDAVAALARMPDVRALSAYLSGLTSKNAELRQACRSAVAALRDEAAPVLEQLAKRSEIPAAALAELREVYSSFTPILSWRVIGPFPRDGRSHPPEKEQNFSATYKGAEKEAKWRTIQADAAQRGRVNLFTRLQPNQQVEAYGYAEIDSTTARDATLLVGSDDTITVWLNGRKVHEHGGDRGWAPDQDRASVRLNAGTNRLLVKCGNSGGPWDFSVAVSAEADRYAFLKGAPQKHDLEAFRAYARTNRGDAERGARLFGSLKGLA